MIPLNRRQSWRAWQYLLTLPLVFVIMFAVACGGDDDSDAATTTGAPTATTSSGSPSSPTSAAAEASPTKAETEASPTQEADATAGAEESPTAAEDATPTEQAEASPSGDEDDPLAEVETIDPEALPNYTMNWMIEFVGMPDGTEDTSITAVIEQGDVDNYHLRFDSDGQLVESWLVDGTSYVDYGTGITSAPYDPSTELFGPSSFLTTVPQVEDTPGVEKVGTETVEGRETTHYRMSGEDFLAESLAQDGSGFEGATNIGGGMDFWIDNELKIMVKADGEVTWSNPDGSDGHMMYNLALTDIGDTPRVEAPQ